MNKSKVAEIPKLTPRQRQILGLIQKAIDRTGAPPTRAEIASALGFRSVNAAEEHLQALARKGVIDLVAGTSRGIRLTGPLITAKTTKTTQNTDLELPLVGRVAAGSPILAQEHIEATYHLGSDLFTQRPDYLLKVRGMSMKDVGIVDGDFLAVRQSKEARNGQIVVARLGDEVTVKRFQRSADKLELLAENPEFAPIVVQPHEPFELEGLAVGLIRGNVF